MPPSTEILLSRVSSRLVDNRAPKAVLSLTSLSGAMEPAGSPWEARALRVAFTPGTGVGT